MFLSSLRAATSRQVRAVVEKIPGIETADYEVVQV